MNFFVITCAMISKKNQRFWGWVLLVWITRFHSNICNFSWIHRFGTWRLFKRNKTIFIATEAENTICDDEKHGRNDTYENCNLWRYDCVWKQKYAHAAVHIDDKTLFKCIFHFVFVFISSSFIVAIFFVYFYQFIMV